MRVDDCFVGDGGGVLTEDVVVGVQSVSSACGGDSHCLLWFVAPRVHRLLTRDTTNQSRQTATQLSITNERADATIAPCKIGALVNVNFLLSQIIIINKKIVAWTIFLLLITLQTTTKRGQAPEVLAPVLAVVVLLGMIWWRLLLWCGGCLR
jgi:hypothetical protein